MSYSYDRSEPTDRTAGLGSVKPLYNHDSEQTAYVVDDYPYGRQRTKKRFWLEKKGRGWRFVGQTLNPKTQRWNKPKASTYSRWGGAMYLDSQSHVQWTGLHEYSDVEDFIEFAKAFPRADFSIVKKVVPAKVTMLMKFLSGAAAWTINDVRQEPSEAEQKSRAAELEKWRTLSKLI